MGLVTGGTIGGMGLEVEDEMVGGITGGFKNGGGGNTWEGGGTKGIEGIAGCFPLREGKVEARIGLSSAFTKRSTNDSSGKIESAV